MPAALEGTRRNRRWSFVRQGTSRLGQMNADDLAKAALKIQAVYRGKRARRQAFLLRHAESRQELLASALAERDALKDRPVRATGRSCRQSSRCSESSQLASHDSTESSQVKVELTQTLRSLSKKVESAADLPEPRGLPPPRWSGHDGPAMAKLKKQWSAGTELAEVGRPSTSSPHRPLRRFPRDSAHLDA